MISGNVDVAPIANRGREGAGHSKQEVASQVRCKRSHISSVKIWARIVGSLLFQSSLEVSRSPRVACDERNGGPLL